MDHTNPPPAHELIAVQLEQYPDSRFIGAEELTRGVSTKCEGYLTMDYTPVDWPARIAHHLREMPWALPYTCFNGSCFGLRYGVEPHEYLSY